MSRRTTACAVVAIAVAASGCDRPPPDGAGAAEDPAVNIWDSAGIEIVENHAPVHPAGEFWTLDPEPEFVLGGSENPGELAGDSAQLIWSVVGLARLPDGRVAVLSSENRYDRRRLPGRLHAPDGHESVGPLREMVLHAEELLKIEVERVIAAGSREVHGLHPGRGATGHIRLVA